jgi:hypothetical protein
MFVARAVWREPKELSNESWTFAAALLSKNGIGSAENDPYVHFGYARLSQTLARSFVNDFTVPHCSPIIC